MPDPEIVARAAKKNKGPGNIDRTDTVNINSYAGEN